MAVCQLGNWVTRERTAGLNHNEIGFLNTEFQKQLMAGVAWYPVQSSLAARERGCLLAKLGLPQCQLPPQSGLPRRGHVAAIAPDITVLIPLHSFHGKNGHLSGQLLQELVPRTNPPLFLASHWPSLDPMAFPHPSPGLGKWSSGWSQRGATRLRKGVGLSGEDAGADSMPAVVARISKSL